MVAHATYKGHDYGEYWFSSYSPLVRDFVWQDGQVTVSPVSGAPGPMEEFTAIGFDEAGMGGRFLKIGVGIQKRTSPTYDFVHAYPVVNEGTRSFSATKTSVRLTHNLSDKETGYGYAYVKTIRMVPGKAQMVIEHTLKNTGKKPIETAVYCHNFPQPWRPATRTLDLYRALRHQGRQAVRARCRRGERQDPQISAGREGE